MIESILNELNIVASNPQGNGQLLGVCPDCNTKHLYINRTSGLWDCKKGCGRGNLFTLVRKMTGWPNGLCFKFLKKHGYSDTNKSKPAQRPRDISWFTRQLCDPDESQLDRFCRVKGISKDALKKFTPKICKHEPVICLPVYDPSNSSICGYLRAGLNGQLVQLKCGKKQKYPAIGNMGLFGLPYLLTADSDKVILTEGWRDALAAISFGYFATASSGGASTWKSGWSSLFKDKTVYIIMDRDKAGQTHSQRTAQALYKTARRVFIVNLPFELSSGKDLYDFIYER